MSTETPETAWKGPWSYTGTREDAEKLAIERQRMASEGPLAMCPRWVELTKHEREMAVLDAANWLTAMRQAGMLPAKPVQPAPMNPKDVPAELVETLRLALLNWDEDSKVSLLRAGLTAVLPAHEALVRAEVAEEIENRHLPLMSFPDPEYVRGLMDAARIARGEHP